PVLLLCSCSLLVRVILPACGDGNVDSGEDCDDGNNLDGDGCDSSCHLEAACGDGVIEGGEQCDGANLGGDDCTTIGQGFTGGSLRCNTDICQFDVSQCPLNTCGNGQIDAGEQCDGIDLGGNDCTTIGQGFAGGALACNPNNCQFDTSGCVAA